MNWQRRDPLHSIPIKIKLPLGFIALYLAVFAIGGYFVITSVYGPLNDEILLRLQSESLAQATLIDKKLELLHRRAEDFASDGFIRTQTEILLSPTTGPEERIFRARERLQRHLRVNKLPLIPEFFDLQVYDLTLRKLVGVRDDAPMSEAYLQPLLGHKERKISAIIPASQATPFPSAAILTPMWDIEHRQRIGYLACRVHLARLLIDLPVAFNPATSEVRAEKYLSLVDRNGLRLEIPWWFLQKLYEGADAETLVRDIQLKTHPVELTRAVQTHDGRHVCINGQEMYGQSYPLAGADWLARIELSTADALKPLAVLEGKLLGIALLVAITTLVLLFFPIQYLVRPLGQLQRMAAEISEGDFSARVAVNSEDEIGSLSKTFNMMAAAVEEKTRHLQQTAQNLRQRERELRIEHDRLQTIVHSMVDGLVLLDANGKILLSNEAAASIVKWLFQETRKSGIRKCDLAEASHRNCAGCLLDFSRTTSCILTIDDRIFEVIATRITSETEMPGKLLVARDITEREKMSEKQAHQERLTVLGKLAAVVAHELNSPLAAISMYNQMMEAELDSDSMFQEHVDVIRRNTQVCRRIIQELLDYAKIPQPRVESVDIHGILDDAARLLGPLHKEKPIEIVRDYCTSPLKLPGDSGQLQQVFVNLILNAIQAVPATNGRVRLATRYREGSGKVIIEIEDNGTGIPREHWQEIFEPFFTTKAAGGTGLGLSTARRIVESHGGELILVDSRRGKTVFQVILPGGHAKSAAGAALQKVVVHG